MSFNLIRNSRMFFTTNVAPGTGLVSNTGFTTSNTFEIQVQDGFSFSQNTASETVTLSEAGAAPVRGQRSFNTALEPVDFSFSTYIRPADGGINITAEESVLWNALFGTGPIGGAGAAWSDGVSYATVVATNSQAHQLQAFGLIILFDGVTYIIDNCALDSATIDFGLDAIASISWAGKGTKLRSVAGVAASTASNPVFSGAYFTGTAGSNVAKGKNTTAPYIANKLSTISITSGITGTGTAYNLALTGGSISISNNITYLTPANLGVVNTPVTYFTGTRSITGSINAYLRAGTLNTEGLLSSMLASSTSDVDPEFEVIVSLGGSNDTKVEIEMPAVVMTIPAISTEQVVSTSINFTAQGSAGNAFDIGAANELTIKYFTLNQA